MSRFYVPREYISAGRVTIKGDELHHARDVMRIAAGDDIAVFDGSGKEYHGTVEEVGRREMSVKIVRTVEVEEPGCFLTLVQALPKSDKMDLIVEKATELGAGRIIPVITERTVVRPGNSGGNKLGRWRKIAVVASKQSGRIKVPDIDGIFDLSRAIESVSGDEIKIIPCLYEGAEQIKKVVGGRKARSAAALIGPEGDFTPEEVKTAKKAGFIPVSLGREVLRSETAAISVISVLSYELNW